MKKVIIAGSRNFNDYDMLKAFCDSIITEPCIVVSGNAQGADRLGEKYAQEKHYDVAMFLPQWSRHGKAAGPIRNELMADYADVLIAFWDGKSRGTVHMINAAKSKGLEVYVKTYTNEVESAR